MSPYFSWPGGNEIRICLRVTSVTLNHVAPWLPELSSPRAEKGPVTLKTLDQEHDKREQQQVKWQTEWV